MTTPYFNNATAEAVCCCGHPEQTGLANRSGLAAAANGEVYAWRCGSCGAAHKVLNSGGKLSVEAIRDTNKHVCLGER